MSNMIEVKRAIANLAATVSGIADEQTEMSARMDVGFTRVNGRLDRVEGRLGGVERRVEEGRTEL